MAVTTIALNDNNPLGMSAIVAGGLNLAGNGNLWRYYFEDAPGTPINIKSIYDYMISEGYVQSSIPFNQAYVDGVINEDPAYVADYEATKYPLAGGIKGGILCEIGGNDALSITLLTNADVASSMTQTFNTMVGTVENEIFFFNMLYQNGSATNQAGVAECPYMVSATGGLTDPGIPTDAVNFLKVLVFGGDNPFVLGENQQVVSFKYPNYVGSPNMGTGFKPFFEWVETTDLTPDKDPYDDTGYTVPDGGDGEVRQSVDIEQPELPPEALMDSGIVQMYAPTKQQLNDFMDYIYSQPDAFFTNVKKLWANPMESIISLSIVPFDVTSEMTDAEVIKFCGVSTNVSMTKVKQYKTFNMGTMKMSRESNTAMDYNNFTKIKAFLPFIGIVDLNTDDCMDADLNLIYNVDMLSGDCIASIQCIKSDVTYKNNYKAPLYQFKGNVLLQAPITGNNYAGLYGGVANMVQATAIPSAGAIMGAAASNLLGQKVTVQRSGTLSGNTGTLGDYTPYVIIESPIVSTTKEMFKRQGYPSNIMCSVASLNDSRNNVYGGFTVFQKDSVFVEGINATDAEKEAIKNLLETGVIFNKPA